MASEDDSRIWQEVLEIIGGETDLLQWLQKNFRKFKNLDELLDCPKLEALSQKQAKRLKVSMKTIFDSKCSTSKYKTDEQKMASISQTILDTHERLSARTFPLITCFEGDEHNYIVEKFIVRQDYVKELCNFTGGSNAFYIDSEGINIDFERLEKEVGVPFGVLGKKHRVKSFFEQILSNESLNALWSTTEKEGSGMYLILPKNSIDTVANNFYLYFHSNNDEDYEEMNPKSRAVHFIRYIAQLTQNILLLLEEKDADVLSNKAEIQQGAKDRVAEFHIDEIQTEKEEVSATCCTVVPIEGSPNGTLILQACGNILLAVQYSHKKSEELTKTKETTVTIKNFHSMFKVSDISDDCVICDSFIESYIQTFSSDTYERILRLSEERKRSLNTEEEQNKFSVMTDFAMVIFIYKHVFPASFEIIKTYFEHSHDKRKDSWAVCMEKIDIIQSIGDVADNIQMKTKFIDDSEKLQRICLSALLQLDAVDYSTKKTDLFTQAWNSRCFGSTTNYLVFYKNEPDSDSDVVRKAYSNVVKNLFNPPVSKNKLEKFREVLNSHSVAIFDKLKEYAFSDDTKAALARIKRYSQIKWDMFRQFIHREVFLEKARFQKVSFRELVQTAKTQCEQPNRSRTLSGKQVLEIKTSKKEPGKATSFQVKYKEDEVSSPKIQLNIRKLNLGFRHQTSHYHGNTGVSSPNNFKFIKVFTGEIPHLDNFRVFPVNESSILVVGNVDTTSYIRLISISNGRALHKQFPRRILLSDYNMDSRLLCILGEFSEMSVPKLSIYKFSKDFRIWDNYGTFDLPQLPNFRSPRCLCLQPNSDYVWILDEGGKELLKLYNKNGAQTSSDEINDALQGVHGLVDIRVSTKGDCIFLNAGNGKTFPLMTHSNHRLPALDLDMKGCQIFGSPGQNGCNVAILGVQRKTTVYKITIQGSQNELLLNQTSGYDQNTGMPKNSSQHWIQYLLAVFTKFSCLKRTGENDMPIKLIAVCEKRSDRLEKALQEALAEIYSHLQTTKKPIQIFKPEAMVLSQEQGCLLEGLSHQKFENVQMGDLIQKLIMFIPVQIARCDFGQFVVLKDGKALPTNDVEDVFEMESKISLGLLEAVFKNWLGPVIVISTMGRQSTGKSYLLNHLFEASFNISGTRCTDGCWLTINVTDGFLFVMMDFEGLGTFERSDEDDMLLTLFNSALSLMTLYKTEKRIDRETDVIFSKFNLGVDYIKGDDNLFQGRFCIIVNDVAAPDSQDVKSEFASKISNIIYRDKATNFISKMYHKSFQIRPFSLFETENFHADIAQLRSDIINIEPVFKSGASFLNTMKLLLAKLALGDFTSLTRQYVDGRIKFLRTHLENAFIFGQLGENKEKQPAYYLRDLNCKKKEIESKWQLEGLPIKGPIDDLDFVWSEEGGFDAIVSSFFRLVFLDNTSSYQSWRRNLETYMEQSLNKRVERVKSWVHKNLDLWMNKQNQDYDDAISAFLDLLNLQENKLRVNNQLCLEDCSNCFLKCIGRKTHNSNHFCGTDHKCTAQCQFCTDETKVCQETAGHEGHHFCSESGHTCSKPCSFASINKCQGLCMEAPNHASDHKCAIITHTCELQCSHPKCNGLCKIDCKISHTVHKCSRNYCLANCCINHCHNGCISKDHFHGFGELQRRYKNELQGSDNVDREGNCPSDVHFCGNEHNCPQECSQKGFCILSTEKLEFDEDFVGKRSTFKYKKRLTNVGQKLPCLVKIPPFQKEHRGDHWCTTKTKSKVHTCKTRCPQCDNLCTKPVDHEISSADVLHRTSHGNMVNHHWLSTNETFEFDNHELEAGESTEMMFCHTSCIRNGRGHTHIVDCPGDCENKFSAKTDHRRHDPRKWLPDESRQRDEIWHRDYWKLQGFEDPCSEGDIKAFEKCTWFCQGDGHDEQNISYCVLGLWHDPVATLQEANLTRGWVSKEGHAYSCTH